MLVSVIIPVLNEEAVVGQAIRRLLAEPAEPEVVVVDGGSQDRTVDVVRRFPPSVRLVEQDRSAPPGRGSAYNQAARVASGDILLFLHVDTQLPRGAIGLVEAAMADPDVVGGGFVPSFGPAGGRWSEAQLGAIEWVWQRRTRARRWFAGDQAPFVRHTAFQACGGYPVLALAEDWAFADRLRSLGRLALIETPAQISPRRYLSNGIVKTLAVTGSIELMYRVGVAPPYLARWYRYCLPASR